MEYFLIIDVSGGVGFPVLDALGENIVDFALSKANRALLEGHRAQNAQLFLLSTLTGIDTNQIREVANSCFHVPMFACALAFPPLRVPGSSADPGDDPTLATMHVASKDAAIVAVSSDAQMRNRFLRQGASAVPDLRFVPSALRGDPLRYVRASRNSLDNLEEAGLELCVYHETGSEFVASLPQTRIGDLRELGLQVDVLDEQCLRTRPSTADLYLLKDLSQAEEKSLGEVKLTSFDDSVVAALSSGQQLATFHPARPNHGHARKLEPFVKALAATRIECPVGDIVPPSTEFLREIRKLNADSICEAVCSIVESGRSSTGTGHISRHVATAANAAAVNKLADRFSTLSPHARTDRVTSRAVGYDVHSIAAVIPATASDKVEEHLIIGAHLDSVSDSSSPNDVDAPGADDDASGTAVVVSLAQLFAGLVRDGWKPRRTMHFALFNGEEQGRGGSTAYAVKLKDSGVNMVSMIQLDMIGWPPAGTHYWEIHCDAKLPDHSIGDHIRLQCSRLGEIIQVTAPFVSPTKWPTFAPLPIFEESLAERSDHHSFHRLNVPAVLITAKAHQKSPTEMCLNPAHYHRPSDTRFDSAYIAEIGRCVGAAVWHLANVLP